jgi:TonB family protein
VTSRETISMPRNSPGRVFLLVCLTLSVGAGAIAPLHAQEPRARKLLYRLPPKYPEYLKIHDIGGTVRLSVEVTPKGTVRSVKPLGGNPILIDAAISAVKEWQYAPVDYSETFEVKIDFVPR